MFEEIEEHNAIERADAYIQVAEKVHSRSDSLPLWEAYREVAIDLQCALNAKETHGS